MSGINAQVDVTIGMQLVGMLCPVQSQDRIPGNGTLKGFLTPESQTANGQLLDLGMVAVLLGMDVGNIFRVGGAFKAAQPGMVAHIPVVFPGAHAVIAEPVVVTGQVQLEAQPGQPVGIFPNLAGELHTDAAIVENAVPDGVAQYRLPGVFRIKLPLQGSLSGRKRMV